MQDVKKNSNTKFQISDTVDGETFVQVDEDEIDISDGKSIAKNIAILLNGKFKNIIKANGQFVRVNSKTNKEFSHADWGKALFNTKRQWYDDKIKSLANADEIFTAAKNWVNEELKHSRKDKIISFGRANVLYRVGDRGYSADVLVGVNEDGSAVLYDLLNIKEKEITGTNDLVGKTNSRPVTKAPVENTLPQTGDKVNYQISDRQLISEQEMTIHIIYTILQQK